MTRATLCLRRSFTKPARPDYLGCSQLRDAPRSYAPIEAVRFAGETLRDQPDLAWRGEEYRVEVTDADQLILFTFIAMGVDSPATKGR